MASASAPAQIVNADFKRNSSTPARVTGKPKHPAAKRDRGWLDDSQPDAHRATGTERVKPVSGLASDRGYDLRHRLPMPTPHSMWRAVAKNDAAKLAYRCGGSAGMARRL
jgi:hypothetical protein